MMNYGEALKQYNTDETVGILVKTNDGNKLLAEHNFEGGRCGCCKGCDDEDDLEVIRVIDVSTMEVLYDAENEIKE